MNSEYQQDSLYPCVFANNSLFFVKNIALFIIIIYYRSN